MWKYIFPFLKYNLHCDILTYGLILVNVYQKPIIVTYQCRYYRGYAPVISYPSLYPVLMSFIILMLQAKGGYRTEGEIAGMDTEIIDECSYDPILIVSIPKLALLALSIPINK